MMPRNKGFLLATITIFSTLCIADNTVLMQLNWYTDQDCTEYMESLVITDDNFEVFNNCENYKISGAGSFNVANCSPFSDGEVSTCAVGWYAGLECTGATDIAAINSDGSRGTYMGDSWSNCAKTAHTLDEPASLQVRTAHPQSLSGLSTREEITDTVVRAFLDLDSNDRTLWESAWAADPDIALDINRNIMRSLENINSCLDSVGLMDTRHLLSSIFIDVKERGRDSRAKSLLVGSTYNIQVVKETGE
ncbi:hypothetical protein B7463_g11127, partial [Scytalidium lignicola]